MEPINKNRIGVNSINPVEQANSVKKKISRGIMDNIYLLCAIMLIILPIIVFLTDIKLTDIHALTDISLALAILWFCSYGMYINCSEAGIKAGSRESEYIKAIEKYNSLNDDLKKSKNILRVQEFCDWFRKNELIEARTNILPAGISYEEYSTAYIGKSKKELQAIGLSKEKIKGIIEANRLKPINLNANKILKRGRGNSRRNPLETAPETKRKRQRGFRGFSTFLSSGLTCFIAMEVIINPSWATVAIVCLKLLTIGMSAVRGYSMGYNNIAVDTTNYLADQSDLIVQCNMYIANYPEPQKFVIDEVRPETIEEKIPVVTFSRVEFNNKSNCVRNEVSEL